MNTGGATVEKHIIHSQISSCFECLLHLLRVALWFLRPCSHFLIGAQWVMRYWWLNMESGCKSLSSFFWASAGAAPFLLERNPAHVVLMPSAIPLIPFLISDCGSPPAPASLFTNCQGAPLRLPHLCLKMEIWWFTSCCVMSGGSWRCWQMDLQWREDAWWQDSRARWGLQRICEC